MNKVVNDFHALWHGSINGTWHKCTYRGVKIIKCPLDLWIYQELIHKHKPQLIIETGTCFGGSAFFLADQLALQRHGKVISIDIREPLTKFSHPRIEFYKGSSTSKKTFNYVASQARGKSTMVILDSDHSAAHVLEELKLYSQLANTYMIVEDTNLGHETRQDHGPGPREAVAEFFKLPASRKFEIDRGCEKFLMTFNPSGYLRYKR